MKSSASELGLRNMSSFPRFLQTNLCNVKYLLSLYIARLWKTGVNGKEKSDTWRYYVYRE